MRVSQIYIVAKYRIGTNFRFSKLITLLVTKIVIPKKGHSSDYKDFKHIERLQICRKMTSRLLPYEMSD